MTLDERKIDDLRAVAHHHMAMLTSAGVAPGEALAIAAHVCALVYSECLEEALAAAFASLATTSSTSTS